MTAGNYTTFKAKHVDGILFGSTAWTEANFTSTTQCLNTSFVANNATPLLDLVGATDTNNPVKSYAFGKDFTESGNERSISDEPLLGVDSYGSQNMEISDEAPSSISVETTIVYRNPIPTSIFNDNTKCCFVKMDNSESTSAGVLYLAYNNIIMTHVGGLTRNANGNMEQKVKFSCRGGTAATSSISVTDTAKTYYRIRVGRDKVEEIRLT